MSARNTAPTNEAPAEAPPAEAPDTIATTRAARIVTLPVTSRAYPPAYLREIADAFQQVGEGYALELGICADEKTARQRANAVARLLQAGYITPRSVGTRTLPSEDGYVAYLVPRDPTRPERKKSEKKAGK